MNIIIAIFALIFTFLLPPIAVLLIDGLGVHFLLNIILLILTGGLLSFVHALVLWIIYISRR